MDQKIFHGNITPKIVAQALLAEFNYGNLRAQALGDERNLKVQIATRPGAGSGGQTALTISLNAIEDGVMVSIGQQEWLGVAADMGQTVIATLINPWNLLGRLDDIAQDIVSMQLIDKVWLAIEKTARDAGAGTQISERLQRLTCDYCGTANAVGEGNCVACGAPLGNSQPRACPACGFILLRNEKFCPNCGKTIY